MIPLIDSNRLDDAEEALGMECWQLLTPLTRYRPARPDRPYAIDNGAFSRFNAEGFRSLLQRERPRRELCKFVAAPDVVGCARRTLEVFTHWRREIKPFPVALVAQDGLEDLTIPWSEIDAVFIGGSTEWKMSGHVAHIIKAAQIMGKWVHVGRVNCPARWEHFDKLGADSCDGSGLAPGRGRPEQAHAIRDRHSPAPLFTNGALFND